MLYYRESASSLTTTLRMDQMHGRHARRSAAIAPRTRSDARVISRMPVLIMLLLPFLSGGLIIARNWRPAEAHFELRQAATAAGWGNATTGQIRRMNSTSRPCAKGGGQCYTVTIKPVGAPAVQGETAASSVLTRGIHIHFLAFTGPEGLNPNQSNLFITEVHPRGMNPWDDHHRWPTLHAQFSYNAALAMKLLPQEWALVALLLTLWLLGIDGLRRYQRHWLQVLAAEARSLGAETVLPATSSPKLASVREAVLV